MSTESKIVSMKTEKFRIAYEAMQGIAAKTLAPESEVKMALLVAAYQKMYDKLTDVIKKVEAAHTRRMGTRDVLTPEGVVKRDRMLATKINVKLPKVLIVRGDLPVKDDAPTDAQNRQSVALLAAALGPFYDHGAGADAKELLAVDLDDEALSALEAAGNEPVEASSLQPDPANAVAAPLADAPEPAGASA